MLRKGGTVAFGSAALTVPEPYDRLVKNLPGTDPQFKIFSEIVLGARV